jgi:Flp pilus assembly protein TadG
VLEHNERIWKMRYVCRLVAGFGGNAIASAAVEFAFTAPFFFLLLFGAIEYGRFFWTQTSLQYAVEEAARCGAVTPSVCPDDAAISTFAVSRAYGIAIASSAFTVTYPSCGIQVAVAFQFSFFGTFPSFTLAGKSCRPTLAT